MMRGALPRRAARFHFVTFILPFPLPTHSFLTRRLLVNGRPFGARSWPAREKHAPAIRLPEDAPIQRFSFVNPEGHMNAYHRTPICFIVAAAGPPEIP